MNDTTFNRLQQCRERIAEDFNKLHKMFQTCHTQEDKHGYILLFTVVDNLHANFTQLRDVLLLDMTEKSLSNLP